MTTEASIKAFLGWIVAGCGLYVGFRLVAFLVEMVGRILG